MSYQLTFSIEAETSGLTLTPIYIGTAGTLGANVSVVSSFAIGKWYGLLLTINSSFRGYIGFYDQSNNLIVMFATNPQEAENLDVRVSALESVGPGGVSYPVCVRDTSNNPIAGAQVWLTSDAGGRTTIAGTLITDSTGTVTFEVPTGIYYLWRLAAGFTFPNPKSVTVN